MQPDISKIKITNNIEQINQLLLDLVLLPRLKAIEWANITKQTPNMKIGYPGQHLASLVTGMPGTRTGARGHDLIDGSETKSCSRVDQLDKCNTCLAKVMRIELECPECGSNKIKRNDDSKWLFTIRSVADLELLTRNVPRVILALADYPFFLSGDFDTISFKTYEIWPSSKRHNCFLDLMTGYYESIYLGHKNSDAAKNPAPKNFWPYSYQFYKCNPVLTFSAIVKNSNSKPEIEIKKYVQPDFDRGLLSPTLMPSKLLSIEELIFAINSADESDLENCISEQFNVYDLKLLANKSPVHKLEIKKLFEMLPVLDENLRRPISLRDTDKPKNSLNAYIRK